MTTMIISVDHARFELAASAAVTDLRERIEQAVHAGGRFVDFAVAGGQSIAILITPRSRVVIAVDATIEPEPEGEAVPFAGLHLLEEI